jgi:hypothetical protein
VLICAPHPNFAGTMENNVVRALAQALARSAVTLRFDYRGVGESEIILPRGVSAFDYWEEVEEKKDYAGALADVAVAGEELRQAAGGLPMAVVGYSFGAIVGLRYACGQQQVRAMVGISPPLRKIGLEFLAGCHKPCLLLGGSGDFVCSPDDLRALRGERVEVEVLEARDHFFRGEEELPCERVVKFLDRAGMWGDR